jgi:hypothetical protein
MADIERKPTLVRASLVKKIAKQGGKRVSSQFIELLEAFVQKKVDAAVACHNGGKKTIDQEVAVWCGIRG